MSERPKPRKLNVFKTPHMRAGVVLGISLAGHCKGGRKGAGLKTWDRPWRDREALRETSENQKIIPGIEGETRDIFLGSTVRGETARPEGGRQWILDIRGMSDNTFRGEPGGWFETLWKNILPGTTA